MFTGLRLQPLLSVHTISSLSACHQAPRTPNKTYFHNVEEHFLTQAVFLLEEFVFGISAGDVPPDQLLAGRRHLQQLGVLVLDGHVLGVAEQLPHDRSKVVRNPFSNKILRGDEKKRKVCDQAVS